MHTPNGMDSGRNWPHFLVQPRGADGTFRSFLTLIKPLKDPNGKVLRWFGSNTDITDQRKTEEELRRANQDLQQFAYSASHDLQEPLRMIATYSELLKQRYGNKMGPQADEYIGYTVQGAMRLETLLRDLRTYTQVSTADLGPADEIKAGEALAKALANLETAITESAAEISSATLPSVRMREFQLEQVFQNLIGNAIRYRTGDKPRVRVAAEQQGEQWLFSVQDNGIGIAPEFKEQVFGIFKRLHSAAEYPGTGMGLAICQRIIERGGGRIWVESELGRGSTFFFTVPCRRS